MYSSSLKLQSGPCYFLFVQSEEFVYPPYEMPLAEAYGGRFESVFVILHPFVRVPLPLSWSVTRRYPDDAQIKALAARCFWSEVAAQIGMNSCAGMNQALLTSIGSLSEYMADPAGCSRLQNFLESQPIWMPVEGRFEPLLQPALLQIFAMAGFDELIFVPEFPHSEPVVRLSIAELNEGSIPFPTSGTLLAPDASFLFTVDWDSFFTLFYGTHSFVADAARALNLEGFSRRPIRIIPGGTIRWDAPPSPSHPRTGRRPDRDVLTRTTERTHGKGSHTSRVADTHAVR